MLPPEISKKVYIYNSYFFEKLLREIGQMDPSDDLFGEAVA